MPSVAFLVNTTSPGSAPMNAAIRALADSKASVASSANWCAPRCTAALCCSRKARSASITWRGRCEVAPESRYTSGLSSRTVRDRIGKSARSLATSSVAMFRLTLTGLATSSSVTSRSLLGAGGGGGAAGEAHVAVLLQLVGQFRATGLDDPATGEHVHPVRGDVLEDPGVVSDQQYPDVTLGLVPVDALGHHPQRIHVEPGVGLVEHRDLRLEQRELQHLVPLLLAD